MTSPLVPEFIEQSLKHLRENMLKIEKCLGELNEEEVWQRPNGASNSVGNLILHLCGNIRQYIISGLGQQPDTRTRSVEFSVSQGFSRQELLQKFRETVQVAETVIRTTNEAALLQPKIVQGFELSGLGIILHVVEHCSYHTGQIAYRTKQLRGRDLAFYAGVNLDVTN